MKLAILLFKNEPTGQTQLRVLGELIDKATVVFRVKADIRINNTNVVITNTTNPSVPCSESPYFRCEVSAGLPVDS